MHGPINLNLMNLIRQDVQASFPSSNRKDKQAKPPPRVARLPVHLLMFTASLCLPLFSLQRVHLLISVVSTNRIVLAVFSPLKDVSMTKEEFLISVNVNLGHSKGENVSVTFERAYV